LLSQAVALDYWRDTTKPTHDFGGFCLTANEEKKRKAAYCIDYDVPCSMVEQLGGDVYQCRSFTENILFNEMDTKEGFLKSCSCPDQTKMCEHIFLVSRVTKLSFSPRIPASVVQQERIYALDDDQSLLCRGLLEIADQNVRILLAKYNEKIKQLKDNPEGLDNLVSSLKQSISIVENVCSVPQSRPARQQ
jgi:hypothetical protein